MRHKALQVLVDGTSRPGRSRRAWSTCASAKSTQQSADEVIGGTHPPGQLIGDTGGCECGEQSISTVVRVDGTDIGTQLLEDLEDLR